MVGHNSRRRTTLQVMQVNVGKGSASHDIALNLAHENRFDIVLIQEPWIHQDKSRRITKKHPAYRCFTPIEDWTQVPRVLTYVRKDPQLYAVQLPGNWEPNRDILATQVLAQGQQIQVINVYNAPPGSTDPGQGVQCILPYDPPQQPVLIAGDFNLKHPMWQTNMSPSTQADAFVEWTSRHSLVLTLQPDSPTRGRNTLDLAWATPSLVGLGITTGVAEDPAYYIRPPDFVDKGELTAAAAEGPCKRPVSDRDTRP